MQGCRPQGGARARAPGPACSMGLVCMHNAPSWDVHSTYVPLEGVESFLSLIRDGDGNIRLLMFLFLLSCRVAQLLLFYFSTLLMFLFLLSCRVAQLLLFYFSTWICSPPISS
ncbi:hypothetical protein O6H91_15G083500 [Diphasiastrum complanatum]|uniref:Uncharacterized protein n=1 Tax=Diphasiastrum complanatum TaxID=34168 RepID=A0ACC2BKD6_DIPCM|nr:hypothetical protein O6H91_15G083500 [Diphasiastrum complanatum]